jgi:hypothetical protein
MKKTIIGASICALLLSLGIVYSQSNMTEMRDIRFRGESPQMRFLTTLTFRSTNGRILASLNQSGVFTPNKSKLVFTQSNSSTTKALTAAQSGSVFVNTAVKASDATTTFLLPTAAAGLNYCFIEDGDASGEINITVPTAGVIVGKTDASDTGTGVAPAAGTGIKNTKDTNVRGDFVCLKAINTTTWLMYSVAGIWAAIS